MANCRNSRAVKMGFCLVLSLPLLTIHWENAKAQASHPAAPVTSAPSSAAPPSAPAAPATIVSPPQTMLPPGAASKTPAPGPAAAANPAPPPAQPILPANAAPAPVSRASMLSLVRNSDPIVQAVMAFLLLCSIFSWTAFIYKSITLAIARRETSHFSQAFQSAVTMDDAGSALAKITYGAAWRMWLAAKQEWDLTLRATGIPLAADQTNRLLQRLTLAMGSAQERSMTRLGSGMGLLATIGSTAPFIGLFGTVWGILDSFEHISASYNTSLTVVAPGIAEALLATAAGLFAAIPATMFYNRFAREVGKLTGMLDNVTADLVVFASRDVERLHR
jgi:biopolymer transport protein ExbB/TolQ